MAERKVYINDKRVVFLGTKSKAVLQ